MTNTEGLHRLNRSVKNIYGFKILAVDGEQKIKPPKADMPEEVKKRIRFFTKYREQGLMFLSCLNFILAYDEVEQKTSFESTAYEDWLPVTEEFSQWRDELFAEREAEVAIAILFGTCEEDERND
ncbi:hypothetical protein ACSFB8_04350 [Enterococcus faecalis]